MAKPPTYDPGCKVSKFLLLLLKRRFLKLRVNITEHWRNKVKALNAKSILTVLETLKGWLSSIIPAFFRFGWMGYTHVSQLTVCLMMKFFKGSLLLHLKDSMAGAQILALPKTLAWELKSAITLFSVRQSYFHRRLDFFSSTGPNRWNYSLLVKARHQL